MKNTKVYLEPDAVTDLTTRLSRIEGHVRGIKRMLAEERSCDDILLQLAAVQAAVKETTGRLLEEHMNTCVKICAVDRGDEKVLRSLTKALTQALKMI